MDTAVDGIQTGSATARTYAIRVQGRLEPRWATRFDGCTLRHDDGATVITGTVRDQAALHGLLQVLRDLGLPLLSITPAPSPAPIDSSAPSSHAADVT